MFLSRYVKGVPFFNGRNTKGVPTLSKMEYKRVRGWTSGRSLPVYSFVKYPPPPGSNRYKITVLDPSAKNKERNTLKKQG